MIQQKEFSVSEISHQIKSLIEGSIGTVSIKGEISSLKIAFSGHAYFSLKDDKAILSAICWKYNVAKLNFKLTEGLEVIVSGKITTYAGQSKYQISVDNITPKGTGSFMQILEARRKQFIQEGLFNNEHKKLLPLLPAKIGIITSMTGAVIKDIIHRISDRAPRHLLIWPVAVQGSDAAQNVSDAIENFNALPKTQKPDLLIIARGGGSIEDLWAFNEEIVVRAAFASKIPIISAIGHETDYTLLDFVADLRAPTPTAAAEFAVPVLADLKSTIDHKYSMINNKLIERLRYYTQQLTIYEKSLEKFTANLEYNIQTLDHTSLRLFESLPKILEDKNMRYQMIIENFLSKKNVLFNNYQYQLNLATKLLTSLDYKKVLNRGYAMIKNHNGEYISSIAELDDDKKISLRMQDGEILVTKSN